MDPTFLRTTSNPGQSVFTGDEWRTLEAASCKGVGRQWTPATVSVSHPRTRSENECRRFTTFKKESC